MGPSYLTHRPVRFVTDAAEPTSADALRVLTAVATLEVSDSSVRGDSGESASPELQEIRARLDLLVALVTQLHLRDSTGLLPPRSEITMSADQIEWVSKHAVPSGPGVLELYLSDVYPEPLRLVGEVTLIPLDEAGQEGTLVSFRPQPQDDDVDDALRRHVFRHHRREIARKQSPPVAR